jgi:hypothetical protein
VLLPTKIQVLCKITSRGIFPFYVLQQIRMLPSPIPLQGRWDHGYTSRRAEQHQYFNAYKAAFEDLKSKGFKPKLNVMDNQATEYIKKISPK